MLSYWKRGASYLIFKIILVLLIVVVVEAIKVILVINVVLQRLSSKVVDGTRNNL